MSGTPDQRTKPDYPKPYPKSEFELYSAEEVKKLPPHRRFLFRDDLIRPLSYLMSYSGGYTTREEAHPYPVAEAGRMIGGVYEILPDILSVVELVLGSHEEIAGIKGSRLFRLTNKSGRIVGRNYSAIPETQPQVYHLFTGYELHDNKTKMANAEGEKFTIELMVPADAMTGGPEKERDIPFEEAIALPAESNPQFLMRCKVPCGNGYYYQTRPRELALKVGLDNLKSMESVKDEWTVELLKKCKLMEFDKVFNQSAREMIKACPNNEMIRGFLLSRLKVPVPPELDTYEKIVDWAEYNVNPPVATKSPMLQRMAGRQARPAGPMLTLEFECERTVVGHCTYFESEHSRESGGIQLADVLSAAEDFDDLQDLLDELRSQAVTSIEDAGIDWESCGDDGETTEDHEVDDTRDESISLRNSMTAMESLKDLLRNHAPETYTRLTGGE